MNSSYYYHERQAPPRSDFAFAYRPQPILHPRPTAPYEYQTQPNSHFANLHEAYACAPTYAGVSSVPNFDNGDLIDLGDTPRASPPRSRTHRVDLPTAPHQVTVPVTPTMIVEQEQEEETGGIPKDVVDFQKKLLEEIRRKNELSQNDHALALSLSTPDGRYQQSLYDNSTPRNVSCRALTVPVPISYGSDAVHPKKREMKQSRPLKTAVGAAGGAVVGGLVTGPVFPVGMILGGVAGGVATRQACKAGERRAQRHWEQASFQRGTESSLAVRQRQEEGTGLV